MLSENQKKNLKRVVIWGLGFVVLLLFDLFVEYVIFTALDFHNTPKNDIFFLIWWIVVGLWFLFGLPFLWYLGKRKGN